MRDDLVGVAKGVDGADGAGLLAGVQVEEAADLAARVHLGALLLEAPDEQHFVEKALLQLIVRGLSHHRGNGLSNAHVCTFIKTTSHSV